MQDLCSDTKFRLYGSIISSTALLPKSSGDYQDHPMVPVCSRVVLMELCGVGDRTLVLEQGIYALLTPELSFQPLPYLFLRLLRYLIYSIGIYLHAEKFILLKYKVR